ncbi:MAG: ATP-binding cassette domain-containing protein [Candidatus Helarchaeota archaeon]|nr:ATP-binding cassette domain-containing protein [Candidatus Helarchaeota archaeon]
MVQKLLPENAIEVRNLTKYYDKLLAVDNINFDVKESELFGFLGPNGAGKTTTIHILTGITKPTSGKASIFGFDLTRKAVKAKELIGVVPEISYLYNEMTAWDNIIFNAKLHSVPKKKREKLARELLKNFGLYERYKDRVSTFSRGMRKRLMIITALVHEPKILFLDEPTTGLDVQSSRQIRDMIKELNKNGTTVFLTTHYIEEADQLCQRIAIIKEGKIIKVDTPENLKTITQAEHIIEVSFDHAKEIGDELKRLSHVRDVITAGDKFRLYVEDPSLTLPLIFNFAKNNHLKIISINTIKPTLEDTFVKLTGLYAKDMNIEKSHVKPI